MAMGSHFLKQLCGTEELEFVPFMAVNEKSPYAIRNIEEMLILKHSFVEKHSCIYYINGLNYIAITFSFSFNNSCLF